MMKTAKELFQELEPSFVLTADDKNKLVYEVKDSFYFATDCVEFDKQKKTYTVYAEHAYATVGIELNQAIQEQIAELGWLQKKPQLGGEEYGSYNDIFFTSWTCPRCGGVFSTHNFKNQNYCTRCGQQIDWSRKKYD